MKEGSLNYTKLATFSVCAMLIFVFLVFNVEKEWSK